MKAHEALKQAITLNGEGRAREALRLLKPLYQRVPEHPAVLMQLAIAYHSLGDPESAAHHLRALHRTAPNDQTAWYYHIGIIDSPADRIPVIDAALERFPTDHRLRIERAAAAVEARDWAVAQRMLDNLVARVPAPERPGCLRDLASRAVRAADVEEGQDAPAAAVITAADGRRFYVPGLEMAVRICEHLLEHGGDDDWRTWCELADIQRNPGRYAAALTSYRKAQALMGASHPRRPVVAEGIRDCRARSGEAERQWRPQRDPVGVEEQDRRIADSIARDIHRMVAVPPPDFRPADPADYPRSARQHCARQETALEALGFKTLGDYEPRHLKAQLSRPTFIRFMRFGNGETVAASYLVYPKRPDGWLRVMTMLLGQWKRPKVIEFQSELSDGRFVITNNTAGLDPFEAGPDFLAESFPPRTSGRTLFEYHNQVLVALKANNPGLSVVTIPDFDALVASESRQQALKNRHRRDVGLATDAELRTILGRQFDRYRDRIREYLADLMARDTERAREPEAG